MEGYGVGAMPRLDFIFSSLLDRWLLFDSSSSTLSSADRSCWVNEWDYFSFIKSLYNIIIVLCASVRHQILHLSLEFPFLGLQLILHLLRVLCCRLVSCHLTFQSGHLKTNRNLIAVIVVTFSNRVSSFLQLGLRFVPKQWLLVLPSPVWTSSHLFACWHLLEGFKQRASVVKP